jgi:hypothetical protein
MNIYFRASLCVRPNVNDYQGRHLGLPIYIFTDFLIKTGGVWVEEVDYI